jgi:hypothetical protein
MGATITPGGGRAVTTWFTADLHLGHHNIIDYCNRPFHDVHAMNDALVENWNEAVAPGDTVWVVGDFALGKIADILPLVSKLHGRRSSWPATTIVAGSDMVGARTAGPSNTSMPASTRSCRDQRSSTSVASLSWCATSHIAATVKTAIGTSSTAPSTKVIGYCTATYTTAGPSTDE